MSDSVGVSPATYLPARNRPCALGHTALLVLGALAFATPGTAQDSVPAAAHIRATAAAVTRFVEHEMRDKGIPGLSIALVQDQDIIWARGFGLARTGDSAPATAGTIYPAGSISKLVTALLAMQEVEAGRLDLDAPVTRYLPAFKPANPWGREITVRQLLAHRAGLVREPPAGHYFDSTGVSLSATVQSLNGTALVFRPESTIKYSNAGFAVAGEVIATTAGVPFDRLAAERLLQPLGMAASTFELPKGDRVAAGWMWTPDGRRFPAPRFTMGMTSAANLSSTVLDLSRFAGALFRMADGRETVPPGPTSIQAMWTPQFDPRGFFGIGFNVSRFEGTLHVGHGGSVYGFATEFHALPEEKLAVVVMGNLEFANSVLERISAFALRSLVAERAGGRLPEPLLTDTLPAGRARELAGHYFNENRRFELRERLGQLLLIPAGGIPTTLRAAGLDLVVDDVREFGNSFTPLAAGSVAWGEQLFTRSAPPRPDTVPTAWAGLLGEYGEGYSPLVVYEDLGRLRVVMEWYFPYPLREVSADVFEFPPRGLYAGERLRFRRNSAGQVIAADLNGLVFPRRPLGPAEGNQLRLAPVRPVGDLLNKARAATPPVQPAGLRSPDLVDLASLDSTIRFDIRYATTNNFLGTVFYSQPRALLQRPAAEAVVAAHRWLRERGYGLLVHDAYRPWFVTKVFWDATPDSLHWLVANPANGSRHNRGAAIDLTLYVLATGQPVEMPGTYDEASPRTLPDYPGGTALQRWHRELLRTAMESHGFSIYPEEWWHFDFDGWRDYPVLNLPFEDLTQP